MGKGEICKKAEPQLKFENYNMIAWILIGELKIVGKHLYSFKSEVYSWHKLSQST